PTNKNGEDPSAPSHPDHLEDYQIKRSTGFVAVRNQAVVDQFGTQTLDVRKPVGLQVPTAKSHVASPSPPSAPAVDHFQCYAVRRSRGSAKFTPRTVTVEDQFGA